MDFGYEYTHIPKDADGIPVFFILPPEVRANYDRKIATCEAGWRGTGHPRFVSEAMVWVKGFRQTVPAWLEDAVYAIAEKRLAKAHAKAAREASVHYMRFLAVREAKNLDDLS